MKKKLLSMVNKNLRAGIVSFVALLCMVVTTGARERIDGIAAVVGDSTILRSEVEAFAYMLANQMGQQPDSLSINMFRQKALEELINGKVLLVKAAKDSNINVSSADIENEVENRIDMILRQNKIDMETFGQM
ncbi:MAG: SurA N-terminal domain-containing protein, partial [Chitinivibrionales bacterium]